MRVVMTIRGDRLATFPCPGDGCRRTVRVAAAFPFSFGTKTCSGCKRIWQNVGPEDWRHAEELPNGYGQEVEMRYVGDLTREPR